MRCALELYVFAGYRVRCALELYVLGARGALERYVFAG